MRNTISAVPRTAMATALLAAVLVASPLAAISATAAAPTGGKLDARDQVISTFCHENTGASSCDDWQNNRAGWNNAQYEAFYRRHMYEYVMNTAEAAAAFGVTGSTMSSSQKAQGLGVVSNHVYDCRAAFGSYDTQTDSYLAYDGTRQKCQL